MAFIKIQITKIVQSAHLIVQHAMAAPQIIVRAVKMIINYMKLNVLKIVQMAIFLIVMFVQYVIVLA